MFYSHINKKDSFDNVVVNEAYFGRTPGVKKIEDIIYQIKKKYDGSYFNEKLNTDPLRYKLNKIVEDTFGFKTADIQFVYDTTMNACTLPIGTDIFTRVSNNTLVEKSNGYRFNPEAGYAAIIFLNTGLALNPNYTAAEITAILLHEIGHNFTMGVITGVGIINHAYYALMTVASFGFLWIRYSNFSRRSIVSFKQWLIENAPGVMELVETVQACLGLYQHIFKEFYEFQKFINIITMPVITAIEPILNWLRRNINLYAIINIPKEFITGYAEEQFSDSFATSYGYGPELNSALSKINGSDPANTLIGKSFRESAPIVYIYADFLQLTALFLVRAFDPHPEIVARISNNMKQLEEDLKSKKYSPQMKQRLLHDIRACKEELNKYKTMQKDFNDPAMVRKQYQSWLLETFEGGDLKHNFLTFAKASNINQGFDKLLAKSKNKK